MYTDIAHNWPFLTFVTLVVLFTPIEVSSKSDRYEVPQFNDGEFCKSVFPSDSWNGTRSNKIWN